VLLLTTFPKARSILTYLGRSPQTTPTFAERPTGTIHSISSDSDPRMIVVSKSYLFRTFSSSCSTLPAREIRKSRSGSFSSNRFAMNQMSLISSIIASSRTNFSLRNLHSLTSHRPNDTATLVVRIAVVAAAIIHNVCITNAK